MESTTFKKLVEAVKKDPALLHALAFEPQKAVRELGFIPESSHPAMEGMQAGNLLGHALGILEAERGHFLDSASCQGGPSCAWTCSRSSSPTGEAGLEAVNPASARFAISFYGRAIPGGLPVVCGPDTTCCCTSSTCGGVTCGGFTCDVTCSGDSCGDTCGNSCGWTSNLTFDPLNRERLLAQGQNQALLWR